MSVQTKIAKPLSTASKAIAQIQRKKNAEAQRAEQGKSNISFLGSHGGVQAKLKVSGPDDKHELEADKMANKVMRMPLEQVDRLRNGHQAVQRKCADCETEEQITEKPAVQKKSLQFAAAGDNSVQRKGSNLDVAADSNRKNTAQKTSLRSPSSVLQMRPTLNRKEEDEDKIQRVSNSDRGRGPPQGDFSSKLNQSKGGGQPLDGNTNSFMSSRFGADFSNVRVHTGSQATQMSNDIQAKAFTHQNHVYFNQGQYKPNTTEGKTLLAHELTHTIQQGAVGSGVQRKCYPSACSPVQAKLSVGAPNDRYEQEADRVAERIVRMPIEAPPPPARGAIAPPQGARPNQTTENLDALSNLDRAIALARNEQGLVKSALRDANGNRYGWERLLEYFEIGTGSVNSHTKDIIKGNGRDLLTKDPQWKLTAWCSIFSFWAYRKAGIDLREWKSGSLPKNLKPIPYNAMPVPGDLAYRELHNHFAIVTKVTPSGRSFTVDTINGNTSNANNTLSGGEVQEKFGETKEKWTEGREKGKGGGGFLRIVDANKTSGSQSAGTPQIQTKTLSKLPQSEALANLQRKSWEKEEEYNTYASASPTVQRKCAACEEKETVQRKAEINTSRGPPGNQISTDRSGNIQRGFWDDPLGSIGNAISDAASVIGDSLEAGITWVKDKLSTMASNMPGYRLFTVVIGKDPISGRAVDSSARNFIDAGLDIIPDGGDFKRKLIADGSFERAVTWLDEQIRLLDFRVSDIVSAFGNFIRGLSLSDVTSPTAALDRGIKIFKPYVDRILTFARNVAAKFLELVKEAALTALVNWIKTKTTLYPLLTLILGKDPITDVTIDRNGTNILRAVILLQADGQRQLTKMEENGSLQRGAAWIDETIAAVVQIVGDLRGAFTSLWTDYKIADFLEPTRTFTKIYEKFSTPVIKIGEFVVRVGSKILEIVREIVVNELLTWVKRETKWYPLITVVLGQDPISGQRVERNGMNLVRGFVSLHPEGEQQLQQMEESGSLQRAATWIDTSIVRIIGIISGLRNGFTTLWTTFKVTDLLYPVETFRTIYNLFSTPVSEMVAFAIEVATMILKFIKDALIARLIAYARTIPGYTLVTVILGKDVFSEEVVERSGENIIRGFMELVPGGAEKFAELKQSGAIAEALAWIEGAIVELDLTWEMIRGLFTRAWNEFSLADLATPIATFQRVMDIFAAPIGRLIAFVGKVVIKLIEIALRIMGFPFALIGSIITRAQTAYELIKNDPVGFLKNILKAVKQGFVQFFGNILTHLLNGVGEWLFGQLGETGITIPTDFSFKSILGLVFEVLGITKEKIFEKLKKKVGPERWARIEGMINTAMGVWSFVKDIMERGPIVIWEKIQEKLSGLWDMVISAARNWIMTKIIEQVTVKLLSFLDPTGIMAVVNSFIAFFRAIQSAIQYMIPMLEMLNSFLGGVIQIAQGNIKPAADLLEQTMARGMPILIGFLANQVGLGSIGRKIKEVIESIQVKVDEGIQWMIDKAWEMGARLLEAGAGLVQRGRDAVAGLFGLRKRFRSNGKSHTLYFKDSGITIESVPQDVSTYITATETKMNQVKGSLAPDQAAQLQTAYRELLATYAAVKTKRANVRNEASLTNAEKEGYLNDLTNLSVKIQDYEKFLDQQIAGSAILQSVVSPGGVEGNNYGKKTTASVLTIKPPVQGKGSAPGGAAKSNFDATKLGSRKGNNRSFYVLGHLLNEKMHGSGKDTYNITPITQDANSAHSTEEEKVKAFVFGSNPLATDATSQYVEYAVTAHYQGPTAATRATKIDELKAYQSSSRNPKKADLDTRYPSNVDLQLAIAIMEDEKQLADSITLEASFKELSATQKQNQKDGKPVNFSDSRVLQSGIVSSAPISNNFSDWPVVTGKLVKKMDVSTERISKEDLMGYTISSKSAQRLATAIPSAALHNDIISKYDQRAVDEYNNPNLEASSYTFATDTRTYIIGDWTNLVTLRNGDPTTQNPITGFDPNVSIAALIPAKLRIETLKDQEDAERTGFNASIKNLVDQLVVKMSTSAKASSKNAAFEKIAPVAGVSKGTLFNWYNNANFNRSKTSRDQIKPLVETFVNNYSASPPQPKLKVGSPSDPLEQEADQMADVVMRSPKPEEEVMRKPKSTAEEDEKVQRKCSKCAEEETAQRKLKPAARISRGLYRKSDSGQGKNPAPTPPRGFDAQIGANKGRGKPLDTQTQSFMENRFGADFSNVKIHTGSNAAELNDKIQAKAFTTGSDIYFNRGEYNPSTQSGKKLLAHELTHTIQQGAAGEAVQRTTAGADFEVNGILDPAEQNPDTVYFDRKSSVLIKEQEDKIVDFMARNINSAELYLYGYSPEEEEGKEKDQLIAGRLSVVEDRVKKLTKKSTTVHTEARPNRSKKSYQYRKYRSVEMSAAEIESGAEKGNSKTRDCNQTEINTVDTVKTKATANIDNGLTQLEDYQKKPADHAGVEALIDRNFKSHDSKTVEKIVAILKLIKQDLAKISSHKKRRCSSLDHQVCASATAFAQAEKSVTFCPKYFNEPEPLQQRILVHEIGHFLKMNLDDRAYSHNRVFKFLSTEEALENTDSFAILINDLNGVVNQDVGNTLVDPSTDTFQNCGTNSAVVEEALAWSQRWSGYADTGLRQTYGDWGNFKFMAKHITALFGPVNRYSIAGLVDRMQLFKSELKKDFDFSCLPDADAACQAKEQITHTANTSFNVCPVFFTLSKPDQIAEVGKAVAKLVTSIPEKHREGYAKIGKAYKTHFFGDG